MGNGSRAGAWRAALLGEGSDIGGGNGSMSAGVGRVVLLLARARRFTYSARSSRTTEGFFRVYEPCSRPAAKSRIW